jgi:hypothetical protein
MYYILLNNIQKPDLLRLCTKFYSSIQIILKQQENAVRASVKEVWISWTFLITYPKVRLKSIGNEAYPHLRPFWTGKLRENCSTVLTLLYVSFKHILINLTRFMGTPNSMRISYNVPPHRIIGYLEVYE